MCDTSTQTIPHVQSAATTHASCPRPKPGPHPHPRPRPCPRPRILHRVTLFAWECLTQASLPPHDDAEPIRRPECWALLDVLQGQAVASVARRNHVHRSTLYRWFTAFLADPAGYLGLPHSTDWSTDVPRTLAGLDVGPACRPEPQGGCDRHGTKTPSRHAGNHPTGPLALYPRIAHGDDADGDRGNPQADLPP